MTDTLAEMVQGPNQETPAEKVQKVKQKLLSMLEAGDSIDRGSFVSIIQDTFSNLETDELKVTQERREGLLYKLYTSIYSDFAFPLPSVGTYIYRQIMLLRAMKCWRSKQYLGCLFYYSISLVADSIRQHLALVLGVIFFFGVIYWTVSDQFYWQEPNTSACFPQCLYFSTIILTTVGLGDIYPLISSPWWVMLIVASEALCGVAIAGIAVNNIILAKMRLD